MSKESDFLVAIIIVFCIGLGGAFLSARSPSVPTLSESARDKLNRQAEFSRMIEAQGRESIREWERSRREMEKSLERLAIPVPPNAKVSSATKPKPAVKTKPTSSSKPIRLLTTECGGVPYPTKTGYIKKCPALAIGGYSSVTVDNSQNDSDVFVKLFSLATTPPKAASVFFIRARDKFTVTDVQPGNYDVRYRDLTSKALSRTEQFNLKEVRASTGVKFSRFTLTLYKVLDGNMQIQPISENEF